MRAVDSDVVVSIKIHISSRRAYVIFLRRESANIMVGGAFNIFVCLGIVPRFLYALARGKIIPKALFARGKYNFVKGEGGVKGGAPFTSYILLLLLLLFDAPPRSRESRPLLLFPLSAHFLKHN